MSTSNRRTSSTPKKRRPTMTTKERDEKIDTITAKLRTAASINAGQLDQLERIIDQHLAKLSVPLDATQLAICKSTGTDPVVHGLALAKVQADERTLAGLTSTQRKILDICGPSKGDGVGKAGMAASARRTLGVD